MSSAVQVKSFPLTAARSAADYLELLKPRLSMLVLVTTGIGYALGFAGPADSVFFLGLAHVMLGTALVAGGAMALNQYMERVPDGLMQRTMGRPLPSGRVSPLECLMFGSLLAVLGILYLAVVVSGLVATLAALTISSYLFLYTPLKTRTPSCTLVGAVPGAIPPMIGYAAATGSLDVQAWLLFTILFVWQMPHFLAIAWMYREDYARGGQMMLPVVDPTGVQTARHVVTFSLTLLPVTLMPAVIGMAGQTYFTGAMLLGLGFLAFAVVTAAWRTRAAARQMFLASVLYLPLLLGLMVIDRT